ncbi:unnamed protein product [Agarophyton chilense]
MSGERDSKENNIEGTIVKRGRKKYIIQGCIDSYFSDSVYCGLSIGGQNVVFNIERAHDYGNRLNDKYKLYSYLERSGFLHVPRALFICSDQKYNYLVLEKVGQSLHRFFLLKKRSFSPTTILLITWKLISILEYLHSTGVVHGLLSPSKILTALTSEQKDKLYLVGFRYAVNFVETPKPTKFIPITDPIFASPTLYEVGHGTRKGDLESLFYSMIFLINGDLPWLEYASGKRFAAPNTDDPVYLRKKNISSKDLCFGIPEFMLKVYDYITSLSHLEKPSYKWIRDQFEEHLRATPIKGLALERSENA